MDIKDNLIELEKPLLIFNRLIYPKNLKEVLQSYNPKSQLEMCTKHSYVSCMAIADTNEQRLNIISKQVQEEVVSSFQKPQLIILDGEELTEKVKDIKEQINGGINEDIFTNWFMFLAFQLSRLTIPLDFDNRPKKDYLPSSNILTLEYQGGLKVNLILFASKGTLLEEPTINELVKRCEMLFKEKIGVNRKTKNKRNPIDSKLRHEVFKRDNYKCKECGIHKKDTTLHVDHILPVSQGGMDELDNLQTLCEKCNLAKSNKYFIAGAEKNG